MTSGNIPNFSFEIPEGYNWLIDRGLVGFAANSPLQPWHYLPSRHTFDLKERWPAGPSSKRLVAFAKRQDCDDIACFEVLGGRAERVLIVHGWTADGYRVECEYQTFWEWIKAVIDDIAEWVAQA